MSSPSTEHHQVYRQTSRFGSLDALRALAILGVVWQHCPGVPEHLLPLVNPGASGVALFFVLSGFLITTILVREKDHSGKVDLRRFWWRRSLRIFPLYYAVLGIYAIAVAVLERNTGAGRLFWQNLPYYLTYTNNWFVDLKLNEDGERRVIFVFAWTLATEEQFYVFWPLLVGWLRRRVAIVVLCLTILADLTLSFWFGKIEVPETAGERLLKIATSPSIEIMFGCLLAIVLHSRKGFELVWRILGQPWSVGVAAIGSMAIISIGEVETWWYLVQGLVFTALIGACVIREDHMLRPILSVRWISRIGVVSYGMYLLHMLCINSIEMVLAKTGVAIPGLVMFALASVSTYLAAEVSFRFFEGRFLVLKDRPPRWLRAGGAHQRS